MGAMSVDVGNKHKPVTGVDLSDIVWVRLEIAAKEANASIQTIIESVTDGGDSRHEAVARIDFSGDLATTVQSSRKNADW